MLITIIGILASTCSAFCMLPQLIKIGKEKAAKDISIPMLLILILALGLWIAYGILKEDLIIAISNSLSIIINTTILIVAVKYRRC